MKLFYVPMTRSSRPRWVLEEIGEPYELIKLDPFKGETRGEAYRKHNPLGHVPALVDGDQTFIESAAICMYLADKFPQANLAPRPGTIARGEYYQWIMFAHATIEPEISKVHNPRFGKRVEPMELINAKKRIQEVFTLVDQHLTGRSFIAGDSFSVADVVMASVIAWANSMALVNDFPRLLAYANTHNARPAAKRARS